MVSLKFTKTSLYVLSLAFASLAASQAHADSKIGVDRTISRGGLDLSIDDDDQDDKPFPKATDEQWEEDQRAQRTARKQQASQRAEENEDFFHQEPEDNDKAPQKIDPAAKRQKHTAFH